MSRDFNELRRIYEQESNLDKISWDEEGLLFLKIRSLTKRKLKDLCVEKKLINENDKFNEWKLREIAFNGSNNQELTDFILRNKEDLLGESEVNNLVEEVKKVKEHAPSVFLDDFNSVLKRVVRDKGIKELSQLKEKIESKLIPTLRAYVQWSWFNQNTNDIIEDIFNDHGKIIPTLRRVGGVDFFLKLNSKEIPADLKLTFLPKEFIQKYRKEGKETNEVVELVKQNPKILGDWLYENQNPRLFNNNIRFFIVLINKSNLEESWKLKSEYQTIKDKVNSFLDSISEESLIDVEYTYSKEDRVSGEYKTKCFILIIEN